MSATHPHFATASPTERKRWRDLALEGMRHGNRICGLHKLSPADRRTCLEFHGYLLEQETANRQHAYADALLAQEAQP